mmetsp:Transcript_14896/g.32302  ORF Transcript_14896/g.32302 Transcript_14896/m.32302 type:complete len:227 (+) Transcript_14896:406-1086(+)
MYVISCHTGFRHGSAAGYSALRFILELGGSGATTRTTALGTCFSSQATSQQLRTFGSKSRCPTGPCPSTPCCRHSLRWQQRRAGPWHTLESRTSGCRCTPCTSCSTCCLSSFVCTGCTAASMTSSGPTATCTTTTTSTIRSTRCPPLRAWPSTPSTAFCRPSPTLGPSSTAPCTSLPMRSCSSSRGSGPPTFTTASMGRSGPSWAEATMPSTTPPTSTTTATTPST